MNKSKWRVIAAVNLIALVGVLVYKLTVPGNQAIGAITGHKIEVRATSASPYHPVHIDSFEYSAEIHFGDDTVQVGKSSVKLPGGLTATVPNRSKVVEVKQKQQGIQVFVDGKEVFPQISAAAQARKAKDLKTFDELRDDLENADDFELLSLDPMTGTMLGKTQIHDRAVRNKLLDAFRKGIVDFHHDGFAFCFDPRHEIFTRRNGDSHLLTICFECYQVEGWGGRKFQVGDTPQPVFDQVLRDAGVPLPKPSRK